MAPVRHPRQARAPSITAIDIPQWAKDEGHNGNARYTATVSADGKLIKLDLTRSSKSPAIDEAVRVKAQEIRYSAATDAQGNPIEGTVLIQMGYSRHDADSPGGGFRDYTCGDLVREWDWFFAAHGEGPPLFWPRNAFTSLSSVSRLIAGDRPSGAEMRSAREQREEMWDDLIERCRKQPDRLVLELVDQPEEYLRLVESF